LSEFTVLHGLLPGNSADKIDDMTALLMANGIMMGQNTEGEGSFDDFLDNPITLK